VTISTSPQKQKPGPRSNRRATIRYRCAPATSGKVLITEDQEFQRAWILDLSSTGAGLELARRLDIGVLLILQLKGQQKEYQLPAHVAHATQQSGGNWLIGCEFVTRLDPADLDDLLD
jgi:hypothetical protein